MLQRAHFDKSTCFSVAALLHHTFTAASRSKFCSSNSSKRALCAASRASSSAKRARRDASPCTSDRTPSLLPLADSPSEGVGRFPSSGGRGMWFNGALRACDLSPLVMLVSCPQAASPRTAAAAATPAFARVVLLLLHPSPLPPWGPTGSSWPTAPCGRSRFPPLLVMPLGM